MRIDRPKRRYKDEQRGPRRTFRFKPHPGPQTRYFQTEADIILAGGGAGGGKTMALLMDVLQGINVPGYEGAMFRKTLEMHRLQGGLWSESQKFYPLIEGSDPNNSSFTWRFESGATVKFYGCDKFKKYDGLQVAYLGFDQLEEFSSQEFWALQSRVRTTTGLPGKVRATCNPEPGWLEVFLKSGGYVGQDGFAIPEMDGVIRWFVREPDSDHFIWADSLEEFGEVDAAGEILSGEYQGLIPTSFTFIRFPLEMNPSLDRKYRAKLQNMGLIERRKKLEGNWNQFSGGGTVYKRKWWGLTGEDTWEPSPNRFEYLPTEVAKDIRLCWAFDVGWSTSGDWTVGTLFGQSSGEGWQGLWWVCDMIKFRAREHITFSVIQKCAEIFGPEVPIVLPRDPGKAGLDEEGWQLALGSLGYEVRLVPDDGRGGDKVARHRFASPQAETGHLKLVTEWRPSRAISLWLSQTETDDGKAVEVTTIEDFAREWVISMDALGPDCPHEVTDVTDSTCRGHRFMSGDDPAGDARLAAAMQGSSSMVPVTRADGQTSDVVGAVSSQWSPREQINEGGNDFLFGSDWGRRF